jgi:hypothetical protein
MPTFRSNAELWCKEAIGYMLATLAADSDAAQARALEWSQHCVGWSLQALALAEMGKDQK